MVLIMCLKKMESMYLLCKVSSKEATINLEQALIEEFKSSPRIKNQSGGGEGLSDGINYIYLLLP